MEKLRAMNDNTKTTASSSLNTNIGIVFQNPLESLNPKMTINDSISEPLALAGFKDPQKIKSKKNSSIILSLKFFF